MPNLTLTNIDRARRFRSGNLGLLPAALAALSLLVACSGTPPVGPIARDPAPATIIRVDADWDDLQAAAVVAAAETETVVLGSAFPSPVEMTIDLATIRDEPVEVKAERLTTPEASESPVPIQLSCFYGRFGDAHEQRRFLDVMARRLADLRGIDYRKVR